MRCWLIAILALIPMGQVRAQQPPDVSWLGDYEKEVWEEGAYFRALPSNSPEIQCLKSASCHVARDGEPARWLSGISALCNLIDGMTLDGASEYGTKYRYQTLILAFSGVSLNDQPSTISAKTRSMAPAIMSVKCRSINFNQVDGNILKFAISKQFDNFIIDVAHRWSWGEALNVVDTKDGRTALDYAYDERAAELNRGSSIANKITRLSP